MNQLKYPNFCIIGGARCATTSLYQSLVWHPQIRLTSIKETHYFSRENIIRELNGPKDKEQYKDIFDLDREKYSAMFDLRDIHSDIRIGDICPSYLSNVCSAKNIFEMNRDCKIIVIVRNPLERLISNYRLLVEYGRETLPIDKAVEAERERTNKNWEWSWRYIDNSLYGKYLLQYLRYFPIDQIKIIKFENLTAMEHIDSDILEYIGIKSFHNEIKLMHYNKTRSNLPFLQLHRWTQMHSEIYKSIFKLAKRPLSKVFDSMSKHIRPGSRSQQDDMDLLMKSKMANKIQDLFNEDNEILMKYFNVSVSRID